MCDEINPNDLFPTAVVFVVEKHRMLGFDLIEGNEICQRELPLGSRVDLA